MRLFLAILVIACTPGGDDEVLVRAVVNGIIEADNRGDIEAVLGYYHTRAVLLPPGRSAIEGKEAIRASYESIFSSSQLQLVTSIEEVTVTKSYAIVTGRNGGQRISLDDQAVQKIDDAFMMMLEKEEDAWKIRKLIWN